MQVPENAPAPKPVTPQKKSLWSRIGGGALSFAVIFHVLILVIGAFWVLSIIRQPEKKVDFMPPGGGGGPRGADVQVQQKKQAQITPTNNVKRVFAQNATSAYVLPEQGDDFGEMTSMTSLSGGGMGGGGLGGSGTGKGFGSGKGAGSGLGTGMPKGIKLFGLDLNVKSIGVVLDVSRSMTPRLKRVVDEVNRVAPGSPLVMQFGCGLDANLSPNREILIEPVSAPRDGFKKFWFWHQSEKYASAKAEMRDNVDVSGPVPSPDVFGVFERRPKTFYHDRANTRRTSDALLSKELKDVEAIYWFADFKDPIDVEAAEYVLAELKKRKQKLYFHVSVNRSMTTEQLREVPKVLDLIAVPSGGGEIKPQEP